MLLAFQKVKVLLELLSDIISIVVEKLMVVRSYRRPGSIGSMYPQKIFKGKKMAGRMGHEQVTVRNLKVAIVDKNLGVIGITGAVPGPRKSIVIIKGANNGFI